MNWADVIDFMRIALEGAFTKESNKIIYYTDQLIGLTQNILEEVELRGYDYHSDTFDIITLDGLIEWSAKFRRGKCEKNEFDKSITKV